MTYMVAEFAGIIRARASEALRVFMKNKDPLVTADGREL